MLIDVVRKRRLQFYGHIYRMDTKKPTKQVFNLLTGYKSKPTLFTEIDNDMKYTGLRMNVIDNRILLREAIIDNRILLREATQKAEFHGKKDEVCNQKKVNPGRNGITIWKDEGSLEVTKINTKKLSTLISSKNLLESPN
ncbi:uncharacterized protein LOC126183393 [Schistocerca cancellata]|uniref:uncharacterized protein LOC126183393 n=1 Tax=Schistocerca cancellata TaxID=274614 RepID=UPI002118EFD0|nr:uncharacterized protein LOC126183393 [Schistocerca cancellata]